MNYVRKDEKNQRNYNRMASEMPAANEFRAALLALKSDLTWIKKTDENHLIALVKFNEVLQATYGITREVLAIFSNHSIFESRDIEFRTQAIESLPEGRSIEDFISLYWSPDERLVEKLSVWNSQTKTSRVALPIIIAHGRPDVSAERTLSQLQRNLTARDWYKERGPVTGDEFFGRQRIIQELISQLRRGSIVGVFGLRKSGKTSLVKEVGRRFVQDERRQRIFVFQDLEALPGDERSIQGTLIERLRATLRAAFKPRHVRTLELSELRNDATPSDLYRALLASISDAKAKDIRIILALDEVESLIGNFDELSTQDRAFVPEFLGAMRALVQEQENFSVILSGLTAAPIQRDELYGRENPLFAWANPFFIPSLNVEETGDLVRKLGRRSAYLWSDAAVNLLYELSGGNIHMLRTLCSTVTKTPHQGTLDVDNVRSAEKSWERANRETFNGICRSVKRHYPIEYELIQELAQGNWNLEELESSFPSETSRLIGLDLLRERSDGSIAAGPLVRFAI